ncbi:MAG TPA: hypothetical protein P5558_16170 [Geminicoccaceae bacterium]|nr:hypothetical protein [Geminicoccaceae bacterium]
MSLSTVGTVESNQAPRRALLRRLPLLPAEMLPGVDRLAIRQDAHPARAIRLLPHLVAAARLHAEDRRRIGDGMGRCRLEQQNHGDEQPSGEMHGKVPH